MFVRNPEVPLTPDQAKLNRFWSVVPTDIAARLDDETRSALSDAVLTFEPKGQGADLRFSNRWFYLRIMAGPERRGAARRLWDKKFFPLLTRQNIGALVVLWSLGVLAAWGVMTTAHAMLTQFLN
jgi:hypothetical protein